MEAGEGPREIYVLDCIAEARVVAPGRRPRHPAIEVEGDRISPKERLQRRSHSRAVEGVCRGILRMVRRRAQWCPRRVRLSIRITVHISQLDGTLPTTGLTIG